MPTRSSGTVGGNSIPTQSDTKGVCMSRLIKFALTKSNLRRAIVMALSVGTLLAAINHYDMFVSGQYPTRRLIQVLVTYLVPFLVSLVSSVLADRHRDRYG